MRTYTLTVTPRNCLPFIMRQLTIEQNGRCHLWYAANGPSMNDGIVSRGEAARILREMRGIVYANNYSYVGRPRHEMRLHRVVY